MREKLFVIVLAVLLLIPISFADTSTYPNPSGVDYDWMAEGRGTFGEVGDDYDTFGKSLDAPLNMPIIDNFDNNSISEMVIIDGDFAKVFQNKELDIVSSVDFGSVPTDISNVISYDIDGDNLKEIIFADATNDLIYILNFTQADGIQVQNSFAVTITALPMIACKGENECIVTVDSRQYEDIFAPFTEYYRYYTFDTSNVTSGLIEIYSETQPSSEGITICSPRTKNIIVRDYDGDGTDEFGLSFADKDESDNQITLHIAWVDNNSVEIGGSNGTSTSDTLTTATDVCAGEDGLSNLITSPVADDIHTAYGNMETLVGIQTDDNDFRIHVFSADGTKRVQYPSVLEANGVIISNIVIGNFFPETTSKDFCVLGYDYLLQEINLLCGTENRPFPLFSSDEFIYDITGTFNISTDINKMDIAIHGVQHSNAETNLNDLDEIISAYGIFYLEYTGDNRLERLWQNPSGDSVINSIDFELFGVDDIIAMTDTNIFYYDDRLSNEPAQIIQVEHNPCPINMIIKVNSTYQAIITARDTNDFALGYDDLNFNAYVYYGTTNEMNDTHRNISTSQTDGTTSVITQFVLNQTGSNIEFLVQAWDNENPTEIDTYEQTFNVQNEGIEFGDVTCIDEIEIIDDAILPTICSFDDDCPNGYVCIDSKCVEIEESLPVVAMQEASGIFRIGITALYLMFMLGLAIAIWFAPVGRREGFFDSANARLGTIFIGESFMLLLGTIFGFLHVAILISLIILGLIGSSIWIVRQFTGTRI